MDNLGFNTSAIYSREVALIVVLVKCKTAKKFRRKTGEIKSM
jgi:hypothetical protein